MTADLTPDELEDLLAAAIMRADLAEARQWLAQHREPSDDELEAIRAEEEAEGEA